LAAEDRAALCALLALALGFFAPIFTGHTFTTVAGHHQAVYPWRAFGTPYQDVPQSDQADLTHPWRSFVGRQLKEGRFPFWNPMSFGGQPLFTNGSSAILYPPNFLAAMLLPADWAHDAVSFLHVLLSGICMYLLMREWRAAVPGALLSGVAWMLSSFNMAWLHLEVVAPVSTWLPASLLLVSRAYRWRSWPATIGAAAALACVLISGHVLFCALVFGVAVLYAAGLTLAAAAGWDTGGHTSADGEPMSDGVHPAILRLGAIVAGPLALAAVVLWPTASYLTGLGRENLPYEVARAGIRVPYDTFRHMIVPPPLPVTQTTMHQMAYVGSLTALFALVGFFRRGPGTFLARLLIVCMFLVATDTLLLQWVYAVLPQFSFFSPLGRLLNLFCFGIAILGGAGLNAVLKNTGTPVRATLVASAVIGFTAWQLFDYARAINPPFVKRDPRLLYPATPMIEALRQLGAENGTAPGRIFPLRQTQRNGWTPPVLFAAESLVFGIDSAGGYDSTLPSRAENVWRFVGGESLPTLLNRGYRRAFHTSFEADQVRFYMLPRLGVTIIAAPPGLTDDPAWTPERFDPLQLRKSYDGPDGQLFVLERATGGPWLVHATEVVSGPAAAIARFADPGFNERIAVILEYEDLPAGVPLTPLAPTQSSGEVRVVEDGINTLRVVVTTSRAGWLVLPNVWDEGWSARVDGREVPVVRANYCLQGVPIAPGDREVVLRYRPKGFVEGSVVSGISIVGALVAVGILRTRRSRSEQPSARDLP
jgi:hypothetical protein